MCRLRQYVYGYITNRPYVPPTYADDPRYSGNSYTSVNSPTAFLGKEGRVIVVAEPSEN